MTRAKERLFLTSAAYRILYGQGDYRENRNFKGTGQTALDPAGDMAYVPTRKAGGSLGVDTGSLDGFAANRMGLYDPLAHAKKAARLNAEGGEKDLKPATECATANSAKAWCWNQTKRQSPSCLTA